MAVTQGAGGWRSMLQLTEKAVQKVKQLMAAENKQGFALRVAVQGGGCSGFQYGMNYEQDQRETDHVLEFDGLKVYVDPMSHLYLEEVKIDYVDTLSESGFKIHNPKASGSCGCGSSFSM
jgi:iron-sulfur cluster assembly accessory protein